jgi:hypothetical protein
MSCINGLCLKHFLLKTNEFELTGRMYFLGRTIDDVRPPWNGFSTSQMWLLKSCSRLPMCAFLPHLFLHVCVPVCRCTPFHLICFYMRVFLSPIVCFFTSSVSTDAYCSVGYFMFSYSIRHALIQIYWNFNITMWLARTIILSQFFTLLCTLIWHRAFSPAV